MFDRKCTSLHIHLAQSSSVQISTFLTRRGSLQTVSLEIAKGAKRDKRQRGLQCSSFYTFLRGSTNFKVTVLNMYLTLWKCSEYAPT